MSSTSNDCDQTHNVVVLDSELLLSEFCAAEASKPLRITCYGSSSSRTPEKYLKEARSLGYILAKRGHVCVNGAGSYGCMAAMNDGVLAGNGHVIGVIHEMFLVDNGYWGVGGKVIRDGGAHKVFENATTRSNDHHTSLTIAHPKENDGPVREILVAGGSDLQERKKLLVQSCDALVVLPGGPGTWDELWEMACARHLNLNQLPIVCVNVDGYYEPFREMLQKAYEDELIKLVPEEIVHFASSSEEAVRWIEAVKAGTPSIEAAKQQRAALKHKTSIIKGSSFFSASPYQDGRSSFFSFVLSSVSGGDEDASATLSSWAPLLGITFVIGTAFGVMISSSLPRRR
ncbi:TIGR00730 family protein [Nitzschia inconspicua]|uniref:TIGR00730 family protein n=1 Tax=Nitzschia inconspicua TaxID=303405 RepID=A0A9K3LF69_9STRA|nr:TIGR00730 family protein [Nitzschia inconspicua]